MIAINSRGDFCHGNGGSFFNVNNVAIGPGASFGWIDDDTAACSNGADTVLPGEWIASKYSRLTKVMARLSEPATGANHGYAGGGHAAWWWGRGGGTFSTTGWNGPNTGLLGMGPDASIGYKPVYNSNGPTMVHELDGSEWQLTPNHAYDLQLLGQHRALFNDPVLGFTVVGIPMPQRLPGACWFPHAFELDGRWWFGCQYDRYGLVAHPFDDPKHGYAIVPPGRDAWPAFRALDKYTLCCVWSKGLAEQAGELTPRRFDVRVDPLVDLVWPDPPPAPLPPRIAVRTWNPLMKAGEANITVFADRGTVYQVEKDASDRLYISAGNDAGTDRTGVIRQMTVEGVAPPPPVERPRPMLGRFWMQPNIGSRDLLEMFHRFEGFMHVDVFALPVQCVLVDTPNAQVNDNTYPNLVAAGAFRALAGAAIALAIEGGVVKDDSADACTGAPFLNEMRTALQRVRDVGGEVAAFSMDEPITNSRKCNLTLDVLADRVATYIHACHDEGVGCGLLEAWPNVSYATVEQFIRLLEVRGAIPDYWHPDIDHVRAAHEGQNVATFIAQAQKLADLHHMTLGLFVNSTVDPIADDKTHAANLAALTDKLHAIHPLAAQVCVASWARRGTGPTAAMSGPQDVPYNLPSYGMVESFAHTHDVFEGTPIPQPVPEVNPMLYKLMENVIRVKALTASSAGGKVIAITPDDKVCSIQPDGSFETRAAGTDGPYEQGFEADNLLLYEPIPGHRYAYAYRVVA